MYLENVAILKQYAVTIRIRRPEHIDWSNEPPVGHSCHTVSYTHLDVYKRQSLIILRPI